MNPDSIKLAELGVARDAEREKARHNVADEKVKLMDARTKRAELGAKAAKGILSFAGANDPQWETPKSDVAKSVANIPMRIMRVQDGVKYSIHIPDPFIFRYLWHPTLGRSVGVNAFTAAITNVWAQITSKNASTTPFTQNDLAGYFMETGSILVQLAQLERAIAVATTASETDYTLPKYTTLASGPYDDLYDTSNYDAVVENLVQLRAQIVQLKEFLDAQLPVVEGFNVFKRWIYLASWIFMDDDGPKPRFHAFVTQDVHIPSHADEHYLTTVVTMDYDNLMDGVKRLRRAAEDIAFTTASKQIAAYIRKAADNGGLAIHQFYSTDDVPGDYNPYIFDEEALLQIRNMHPVMVANVNINQFALKYSGSGFIGQGVYTNNGELSPIVAKTNVNLHQRGTLLSTYDDRVLSETDVFVATRFLASLDYEDRGDRYYYYDPSSHELVEGTIGDITDTRNVNVVSYGTELVVEAVMFTLNNDVLTPSLEEAFSYDGRARGYTALEFNLISKFDNVPAIYYMQNPGSGAEVLTLQETDVYALISVEDIDNIHQQALGALWSLAYSLRPSQTSSPKPSQPNNKPNWHKKKGNRKGEGGAGQSGVPNPPEKK